MFDEILAEIEKINGPVTVKDLALRLDIEESALDPMLEFLEKKGKLSLYRPADCDCCGVVSCRTCVFGKECPQAEKGGAR
ncbi:MAG TPA: FeoC-like transcriptional regulator [Candidatus Anoxymicrobiaceae bacterium]|jgi:predicted Zn-ribbon and HTH transcriptional regulator